MKSTRGRFCAGMFAALLPLCAGAWRDDERADQCDSIDSIPMRLNVDYNTEIQPIWSKRCANCHVDSAGNPSAGLDLDPMVSWFYLFNEPSSQDSSLIRVVPRRPRLSLLYNKVNCEGNDVGVRMPRDRPPLPLSEQALIHDWILGGAFDASPQPGQPVETIFHGRFEIRG